MSNVKVKIFCCLSFSFISLCLYFVQLYLYKETVVCLLILGLFLQVSVKSFNVFVCLFVFSSLHLISIGLKQELCILLDDYWERMNLKVPIYFSAGKLRHVKFHIWLFFPIYLTTYPFLMFYDPPFPI